MRNVVWLVLLFAAAVVAALVFGRNDGLVSIFWGAWRTDLSLNLFALGLLFACALLMVTAKAVVSLVTLPRRASEWRARRRRDAAQAALREAQAEMFSARYGRAYKAAQRAIDLDQDGADREFTVLARLLAAESLHRLQDREGRDRLLKPLFQARRGWRGRRRADEGARLLAAKWALDDGDAVRALALLAELPPGAARRTQALRLRLRAARQAGQPAQALHMARLLAKHNAFSPDVAQGLTRSLATEALRDAHDIDQLRRLWQQFDPADRRDPHVVARAAERAAQLGALDDGRDWLKPHWERLAELDGDARERVALALIAVCPGIPSEWLARLEDAVRELPQDAAVLAAVGSAYVERQLWGKARALLEQAAQAATLPAPTRRQAWRLLARLARDEADEARAVACEQAAASVEP